MTKVPSILQLCLLPVLVGVGLSILFGRVSSKVKGRWIDKLIQLFCILAISAPVFYIGMELQYNLFYLAGLYSSIGNYVLPQSILFIVIPALIIWQTHPYIINRTHKKSIISNTLITGISLGFILFVYTLLDITFGLNGFGDLLVDSINLGSYTGVLFALIIIFFIVTLFSNLLFSGSRYIQSNYFKRKTEFKDEVNIEKENNKIRISAKIKTYLLNRLISPYFYIGAVLVSIIIAIAISPNLITPYSLQEAVGIYPGAWSPPSPDHPLGQGVWGRDILALIMWGIQDLILFGFGAVLIGLIGGVILGYIVGKFNRWGYNVAIGSMILFYVLPIFVYVMVSMTIFGSSNLIIMLTIGVLLIPSFARGFLPVVSRKSNIERGVTSLISQIPLNFAISAMIYTAIGFLGLSGLPYQLGNIISQGRPQLYMAPLASLRAGIVIFAIIFSFLLFHIGLKDYKPKLRK